MNNHRKTAVITGGSKGIGLVIAEHFAATGYIVFVGSRSLGKSKNENIHFVKMNVENEKGHFGLIKNAVKLSGSVNVYINCAGLSEWKPISKVDSVFLNKMTDVNLKGVVWGCKAAASVLKAGGSILNISSLAGKRGSANNSIYCAVKFAVNGITQSLAKELGPRGVRVNAVCPVYIKTDGLMSALEDEYSPSGGGNIEKYLEKFAQDNAALKRLPLAEEVAKTCLFLASDNASAVTGQCINVDCGVLPQ
jgi:NAD(P)-dependent dehydrogenase (short-subunit alcohol dehydrogenase family)